MERCPNCRARREEGMTCRRCGMELGRLIEVEEAAERLTLQGIAHLAAGDPEAATADLSVAQGLRRAPFAETLLGFVREIERQG
jgi:hypothetical protein